MLICKVKIVKIIEGSQRFTVDLGIGKYIFKASVSYILRIRTIFPFEGFKLCFIFWDLKEWKDKSKPKP